MEWRRKPQRRFHSGEKSDAANCEEGSRHGERGVLLGGGRVWEEPLQGILRGDVK